MTYEISDTGTEVLGRLATQGFALPDKPRQGLSPLPEDLTEWDDADLMDEFAVLTAWADYAEAQHGLAVIAERDATRHAEQVQADSWPEDAKTVSEAKAKAAKDPDVFAARTVLDKAVAYRKMVGKVSERYERDAALLSRELTRRTQSEWNAKQARRERYKA